MKLPQYSILQISARTILNCGQKTEDGWRFCFDTNDETSRSAIRKTMQDDCAMFHQLLCLTADDPDPVSADPEDKLMGSLVYLDFTGIFDRRAVGQVQQLQDLAEWLFRPEGIELTFTRGPVRFRAFERSASMSRNNRLSFVRADLYDALWEAMTLGMTIGNCQLSKLYAYNGLMFTSGQVIGEDYYTMSCGSGVSREHDRYPLGITARSVCYSLDADHIIVVDNPRSIIKDVPVITVEDDGSDGPVRRYSRVEKRMDVEVLEFDGEGLISQELALRLDPYGYEKHDHHSFQIRLPYIKGVVHEVDIKSLFAELGVDEIEDIEGVCHPVSKVDMILTKSMCKGWGWMQENGLSWKEYLERCRRYGHKLFVSNMDRRSRDGLTELNFQLLNTAAITAEEYRPRSLPLGWETSPADQDGTWFTKATEIAYYNAAVNKDWQLADFAADKDDPELDYGDGRRLRAELLSKNPAFLREKVFQKELADKAKQILERYGMGKLQVNGDTRYLSDDLMRLLADIVRPTSPEASRVLEKECLKGAQVYAPQPAYAQQELLTILRNPHISRNEEALVTPLSPVGPLREKYLSHLYYVAMVDSRSLIPDRLGGADYDGDTVHLYAEPMLCRSILRNYAGGLENDSNLPLLKIPSAEALIADASDWRARFLTVKSTFSSRIGQISNAALRRSILAYDEAAPEELREQCRKETEILTILTGLEIDSAKSGIKPDLSEYLGHQARVQSLFLRYKEIAGEPDEHAWYDPTRNQKLRAFFNGVDWDEITANLERTPFYARELGRKTKVPKAEPADSGELFTFAKDLDWKEKLDPHALERMRSIIADYEEAKRRCEAYRHITSSGNYRKDIQRILFSQDRENEISVDALYDTFSYMSPYDVHTTLSNLRESRWQFTPKEDRLLMLYTVFTGRLPSCRDILCDFRCGGYRILGDILMDLDDQHRDMEVKRHKGVRQTDTEQMKRMMRGAADSHDYRQRLIRNCLDVIRPNIRPGPGKMLERLDWDEAVMCAEALGKRAFILEVLPAAALELAVDRSASRRRGWIRRLRKHAE